MKTGPEVVVSCDIDLGERFNFVDLDSEAVSGFLSNFDIPQPQNPLRIAVKSSKDMPSIAGRRTLGRFSSRYNIIEIYPEEIYEPIDGKIEPVAEGTLFHELGHYVDSRINPELFQADFESRASLIMAGLDGLRKIKKRSRLFLASAAASAVADFFVDRPSELQTALNFSFMGFIALTLANFVRHDKAQNKLDQINLSLYDASRNERFANEFVYNHYFPQSGMFLSLEKKL